MNRYKIIVNAGFAGEGHVDEIESDEPMTPSEVDAEAREYMFERVEYFHELIEGEYAPEPEPEVPETDPLSAARDVLAEHSDVIQQCRDGLDIDTQNHAWPYADALVALADALEAGDE